MRLFGFLLMLFSLSSFSKGKSEILNILNSSKKKDFSLESHFNISIGYIFKPQSKMQKRFLDSMNQKDYTSAFELWLSKDMQKTSFSKTSSGKALYGFLLFKNGFPFLGLSQIFNESQASQVHSSIYYLLNKELSAKHQVWDHFIYSGSQKWNLIDNKDILFKVGAKSYYKDQKTIEYLLGLATAENFEKFPLEWELVLLTLKKNDMEVATQILNWLIKKSKSHQKDKAYLTIARLLYGIGEDKAASFYYKKIKQGSSQWIHSKEEEAWIHYNNKDYYQALTLASALLHPEFQNQLRPEAFLITALSQLKSCDYKGVNGTLKRFKVQFKNKHKKLKEIRSNPSPIKKELTNYYNSKKQVSRSSWPILIEKDIVLKNHLLLIDFIKKNDLNSEKLHSMVKKDIYRRLNKLEYFADKKIKKIAQTEISQIDKVLNLMELIETSALYRIYGFHNLDSSSVFKDRTATSFKKSKSLLYFPYERNEIWMDELDKYQLVSNVTCPGKSYVF